MKTPVAVKVIKLSSLLKDIGDVEKVELARSTSGKPALKVSASGYTYIYSLVDGTSRRISLGTADRPLELGDVAIRRGDGDVVLTVRGKVFRGWGFVDAYETSTYVAVCRRSRCVTGIIDLVDGETKLYSLDVPELRTLSKESVVSVGYGGFSMSGRSVTVSTSVNGVEVLPGFFKYVASCSSGDYLVDREGFLVRVRKSSLGVVGKVGDVVSAACVGDGVAVASGEGLKIVRYGAYTTILGEVVREVSSHKDVVSIVNRSGLVRVLSRKNSYTLDSPALKTCKLTTAGLACLTEDSVIFLEPEVLADVVVEIRLDSESGLAELIAKPWFESCRYLVHPRSVAVLKEEVGSGVLRAKLYSKVLGWEGYVRAVVECPTYSKSTEEHVRFGSVEVEELTEKFVAVARYGRLLESRDSNCVGRFTLRLRNPLPVQIPIEVRFDGVENVSSSLSSATVDPGYSSVSARFAGKCLEGKGLLVKLIAKPGFVESDELASVYIDSREFKLVDRNCCEDVEVANDGSRTVIRAVGRYLKLHCLDGKILEGKNVLLVENCEEPALLEVAEVVDVNGELFEFSTSRVLREATRKCLSGASTSRVHDGGFYSDCSKYEVPLGGGLYAKIEYSGSYKIATYVGGSKLSEVELSSAHLLAGISLSLGTGRVGLWWRDLVEIALRSALAVGSYMREVILENPGA
ncbi:MAG: hypothetical protein RMH84_03805 [Sulfolobales archaeon]|nr:hypothetical protein [Sulfolobales archaeon]MCX8208225.1 hypothetical protein [Sulfolobales archaeon]MDW8010698.1 hypothetical protein [Sulfolobales archaeon]